MRAEVINSVEIRKRANVSMSAGRRLPGSGFGACADERCCAKLSITFDSDGAPTRILQIRWSAVHFGVMYQIGRQVSFPRDKTTRIWTSLRSIELTKTFRTAVSSSGRSLICPHSARLNRILLTPHRRAKAHWVRSAIRRSFLMSFMVVSPLSSNIAACFER